MRMSRLQAAYQISDAAVSCIFQFIAAFLFVLSHITTQCADLAKAFPASLYMAKKRFVGKVDFIRYVLCRKCFSIHHFKDCVEGPRDRQRSKLCYIRKYPHHPHSSRRGACKCILLKSVELAGGRHILYPYLMYCYL